MATNKTFLLIAALAVILIVGYFAWTGTGFNFADSNIDNPFVPNQNEIPEPIGGFQNRHFYRTVNGATVDLGTIAPRSAPSGDSGIITDYYIYHNGQLLPYYEPNDRPGPKPSGGSNEGQWYPPNLPSNPEPYSIFKGFSDWLNGITRQYGANP